MRTVGIIAEYDPFHNGHLYQMEEARKRAKADYVVVVMSGDFVQRGEPALLDKWVRAAMALRCGADLVLELPVRCASGSAEYFASEGVRILNALGCVDALSFGCETEHTEVLEYAARFFSRKEPAAYSVLLQEKLKSGLSFPLARSRAFLDYLKTWQDSQPSDTDQRNAADALLQTDPACMENILSGPNNILAMEYLKAILRQGSPMHAVPVKRLGDYHASSLAELSSSGSGPSGEPEPYSFASASALRKGLADAGFLHAGDPLGMPPYTDAFLPEDLLAQLPQESAELLTQELSCGRFVTSSDLDLLLHAALLERCARLEDYLDVNEDLAGRIRGRLGSYTGFDPFAQLVQTRAFTLSRVRRALLHILLDIRKTAPERPGYTDREEASLPGIRVLGFRRSAAPLLHTIRSTCLLPLVTKLPPEGMSPEDRNASILWEMIISHKTKLPLRNERQRQIVIV